MFTRYFKPEVWHSGNGNKAALGLVWSVLGQITICRLVNYLRK